MMFPVSIHVHLLPFLENEKLYERFVQNQNGDLEDNILMTVYVACLRKGEDGRGVQNLAANLRVFSDKGVKTPFDQNMPPLAGIEPGNSTFKDTFKDGTSTTIAFATKHGYCGGGGSRYVAAPNSPFAAFFGQDAALVKAHPSDPTATFQLAPSRAECLASPLMAQSVYKGHFLVALADGGVRILSDDISPRTWNSALQPNDGNELGNDW